MRKQCVPGGPPFFLRAGDEAISPPPLHQETIKASSQPAIAQTYTELSNGYTPASNAKKLKHSSHLISVNYCNNFMNY